RPSLADLLAPGPRLPRPPAALAPARLRPAAPTARQPGHLPGLRPRFRAHPSTTPLLRPGLPAPPEPAPALLDPRPRRGAPALVPPHRRPPSCARDCQRRQSQRQRYWTNGPDRARRRAGAPARPV